MSGVGGLHDDVLLEAEERKVIAEFCHLLEKSKQLFNGLRDMPQVVLDLWANWIVLRFIC